MVRDGLLDIKRMSQILTRHRGAAGLGHGQDDVAVTGGCWVDVGVDTHRTVTPGKRHPDVIERSQNGIVKGRTLPSAPAGGVPVCVLVHVPVFQSACDVKLKDAAHEVLLISNPAAARAK